MQGTREYQGGGWGEMSEKGMMSAQSFPMFAGRMAPCQLYISPFAWDAHSLVC
jgi:hypothetical protein